jgi:hypothetical protein
MTKLHARGAIDDNWEERTVIQRTRTHSVREISSGRSGRMP